MQNPIGGSELAALEICIDTGKTNKDQLNDWIKKNKRLDSKVSIKEILKYCSNAFQTWRYLHEVNDTDDLFVISYEYLRLDLIANKFRDTFMQLMHNNAFNSD